MWPKCPKCKSDNLQITEVWSGRSITWEPKSNADEGCMSHNDNPSYVIGNCRDCGHGWRFRRIIQVKPEWWDAPKGGE